MNPSALSQNIGVGDIISSPGFWNKLASNNNDAPVSLRQENFLRGFIHEMKEAGASPFAVVGFMEEMSKLAGTNYTVSPEGGIVVNQSGPLDKLWSAAGDATRGIRDKAKVLMGTQDNSVHARVINGAAAEKSPFVSGIGKAIFSDPDRQAVFNVMLNNGQYMDAASMAGNHIGSSEMVKKWAPSVVPALATVAAGRLAGAGWGTSLALGAGAGFLGHKAHQVGGIQNLANDYLGTSFPGGPRPTPPVVNDAVRTNTPPSGAAKPNVPHVGAPGAEGDKPNAPTPGVTTLAAQNTMKDNSANADRINERPTD